MMYAREEGVETERENYSSRCTFYRLVGAFVDGAVIKSSDEDIYLSTRIPVLALFYVAFLSGHRDMLKTVYC